jgi:SOS-response transcriptional repressor LexA
MRALDGESVGALMRARRSELSMSLSRLSELVGCAKSYLSEVETQRRGAPSDELLKRVEHALMLPEGRLVAAAGWQRGLAAGGEGVREEVARLEADQRAARRLAELLRRKLPEDGCDTQSGRGTLLDEAYRSGELRALVERLASGNTTLDPQGVSATPASGGQPDPADQPLPIALSLEVPLINKVAAGYPREFTDLAYPARVADEYVRCPDLVDADAFAARVVGDSMQPAYAEGDIVIFSPAKIVKSGMDCFARLEPDHQTTFKRVYFEQGANGEEMIRLQPLNSAYPPRIVEREMVAGLYAAVSVMRRIAAPD